MSRAWLFHLWDRHYFPRLRSVVHGPPLGASVTRVSGLDYLVTETASRTAHGSEKFVETPCHREPIGYQKNPSGCFYSTSVLFRTRSGGNLLTARYCGDSMDSANGCSCTSKLPGFREIAMVFISDLLGLTTIDFPITFNLLYGLHN
jgi:hypothetical protein